MRFFAPFEDFATSPLPGSIDAYRAYRQLAIDFIEARNLRISSVLLTLGSGDHSKESA